MTCKQIRHLPLSFWAAYQFIEIISSDYYQMSLKYSNVLYIFSRRTHARPCKWSEIFHMCLFI